MVDDVGRISDKMMLTRLDEIYRDVQKLLKAEAARVEHEKKIQEDSNDHETRIRNLETLILKLDGKIDKELGVIKERNTIANIVQLAFSTTAATLAAIFGGGK